MSGSDEQASNDSEGDAQPETHAARESELLAELLETQGSAGASSSSRALLHSPRVGRFCAWDPARGPLVDFDDNPGDPVVARSAIALDPQIVGAAIAAHQGVLLTFEAGRSDRPIVTGLLQALSLAAPIPAAAGAAPEAGPPAHADPPLEGEAEGEPDPEVEVDLAAAMGALETRIDGRRVELEAADEIVLRCGKASIVLRRNGRVVIRGTYVETRSRGVNRIKGGSVEIN